MPECQVTVCLCLACMSPNPSKAAVLPCSLELKTIRDRSTSPYPSFVPKEIQTQLHATCTQISISSESRVAATMLHHHNVVSDIYATALSESIVLSMLRLCQETAKRGLFDQNHSEILKLNRKLVHISIGLVFMLCWPLFSTDSRGSIFAALIPGINIIQMLLMGLGIWKDKATVKSMSRFGDYSKKEYVMVWITSWFTLLGCETPFFLCTRDLLKGPLYYASSITLSSVIYSRTSPISIAAIRNLCAGDGMTDIVGRRFGSKKIPYNRNKSFAGSITMTSAGFLASIGGGIPSHQHRVR